MIKYYLSGVEYREGTYNGNPYRFINLYVLHDSKSVHGQMAERFKLRVSKEDPQLDVDNLMIELCDFIDKEVALMFDRYGNVIDVRAAS